LIYDVAIVGAGPSGAAAAHTLENLGYEIALVDKERFPRAKPCAGVLPPRIYSELDVPGEIVERPLEGYRIFPPSGEKLESVFPKMGCIVRRESFDDFLVKRLKTEVTEMHVADCVLKDDFVEVKGREGSVLSARVVVGADGVNSVVSKSMGMDINSKQGDYALALQYEIILSKQDIDEKIGNWFEVYYTIPYGYGWISPLSEAVKVGMGSPAPSFKKNSKNMLQEFLDQSPIKEKVSGGTVKDMEAHMIPMRGPWPVLSGNRCLVVGDAGGFVFPGTGEGVYYAIKSGRIAAEVIHGTFEKGNWKAEFLEKTYIEQLRANGLISLREVDFVERVLSSPENIESYIRRLRKMGSI
jgi:geranylgeranyl reductase family protein